MIRTLALSLLAATAVASFAAPALAADLVLEEDTIAMATPPADHDVYIGPLIGTYPGDPFVGAQLGVNMHPAENFLIGLAVTGLVGPGFAEGWLDAHVGVAMDSFSIYGLGGVGFSNSFGPLWQIGLGADAMVTDNVSIFAEVMLAEELGDIPDTPKVQGGIRWHF